MRLLNTPITSRSHASVTYTWPQGLPTSTESSLGHSVSANLHQGLDRRVPLPTLLMRPFSSLPGLLRVRKVDTSPYLTVHLLTRSRQTCRPSSKAKRV